MEGQSHCNTVEPKVSRLILKLGIFVTLPNTYKLHILGDPATPFRIFQNVISSNTLAGQLSSDIL